MDIYEGVCMNLGIPDKVQVEVVVQSRCFCCSRNPKADSPKKSISQKLTSIFKSSTVKEENPTPMRARTTSFAIEE